MNELINSKEQSSVINNLIDKLFSALGWVAHRDTPKKIAINTYIEEIKKGDYDPLTKAALITNAKKIIKEYSNQAKIIQNAIPLLTEKSKPLELDDDWLNAFMDKARLISDDEFQIIWSKILVSEINQKNSFSIRTLNKVKDLSKKEAEIFSKVAELVLQDCTRKYIVSDINVNAKHGITLEDVLILEECGFLNSQEFSLSTTLKGFENCGFLDNGIDSGIFKSINGKEETINVSVYVFTESGKELLNALTIEKDESYLIDVLKSMKQKYVKNSNVSIEAHRVLMRSPDGDNYMHEDLLTSDLFLIDKKITYKLP